MTEMRHNSNFGIGCLLEAYSTNTSSGCTVWVALLTLLDFKLILYNGESKLSNYPKKINNNKNTLLYYLPNTKTKSNKSCKRNFNQICRDIVGMLLRAPVVSGLIPFTLDQP